MSAQADNDCARCGLALHNYSEATDCRMCDPLCPVFGTHGELWDGDEETSRAAYLAGQDSSAIARTGRVRACSLTASALAGMTERAEDEAWAAKAKL